MEIIETKIEGFFIRQAQPEDVPLVLELIGRLAEYERLSHMLVATETGLEKYLFGPEKVAEVILGYHGEVPVGYALYFYNFSTFLCRPGLYLEDIFVLGEYRGRGFGKAMLAYLARLAVEKDCGRMEWVVLDWNEPSIRFYKSMGAELMDEWIINRVSGEALRELASKF
ncbi:MAG TPA: GNAT family N-acetyltransferase [Bacteroides sp.]|nr:GNAT family N-acetyltransferase [Bacteroides sp.]